MIYARLRFATLLASLSTYCWFVLSYLAADLLFLQAHFLKVNGTFAEPVLAGSEYLCRRLPSQLRLRASSKPGESLPTGCSFPTRVRSRGPDLAWSAPIDLGWGINSYQPMISAYQTAPLPELPHDHVPDF